MLFGTNKCKRNNPSPHAKIRDPVRRIGCVGLVIASATYENDMGILIIL